MVDVSTENGDREGIITRVQLIEKEKYKIDLRIIGDPRSKELKWPSAEVHYCQELIPNRKCDPKSMNPEEAKKFKLNICFSAAKVCEKGYLLIIL